MLLPHPMESYEPQARSFNHVNKSNPKLTWGSKFEIHCLQSLENAPLNCLIGDSHIERLSGPLLLPLTQATLRGWRNLGVGGDKAENILWRLQHGGFPSNPHKVILMSGSNNLNTGTSKNISMTANTIIKTVNTLSDTYPEIEIAVVGVLPREGERKCQAARTVNDLLKFKLPTHVSYISPPNILFNRGGTPNTRFFYDDVHLNPKGYRVLLDSLGPFIKCRIHLIIQETLLTTPLSAN